VALWFKAVKDLPQEEFVGGVLLFLRIRIPELIQELAERRQVAVDHFKAGEHTTEVRAVVAVVEEADVPATAQLLEKLRQRDPEFVARAVAAGAIIETQN